MRFLRRSLVGLFLAAVSVGLIGLAVQAIVRAVETRMAADEPVRPARERVFAVNAVTVRPETVTPEMIAFGQIRSRRTLQIRAPVSGDVVWLSEDFAEGAAVTAGAPLLRIDAADATGRRDSAQADLAEAEAEDRDARRSLDLAQDELTAAEAQAELRQRALVRQQDLQKRGVGSASLVEEAELQASAARQSVLSRRQALAQAQARIDQAGTAMNRLGISLAEAERRLAETEIRAPFDGRLSGVTLTEGGLVSTNEQVAELIDPDALEVAFRISASQYARLLDGDGRLERAAVTASLDVSGVDILAAGRITRDSPAVGEGQTGRLIFATLDSSAGFRPGDFVTVRITEPPLEGVARLPASALDAAETVLAIGADERLEPVSAPLLRRQGDEVIVAAGEIAGRSVVTERTPFLGAGIRVRVIDETPADAVVEASVATPAAEEFVELDDDRRARLVAFVEGNTRLPTEARERMLAQLREPKVPAGMVERIESRIGG